MGILNAFSGFWQVLKVSKTAISDISAVFLLVCKGVRMVLVVQGAINGVS